MPTPDEATRLRAVYGDLVVTASSITVARGGPPETLVLRSMLCHDTLPLGFGGSVTTDCVWVADRCHGTLQLRSSATPAATQSSLTLHAEVEGAGTPELCARFEGDFSRGTVSDPRAGGPPADPDFPGAACLVREQILSADRAACATVVPSRSDESFAVTTYVGACCVGAAGSQLTAPAGTETWLVDAATVVVLTHPGFVERDEVSADPTLAVLLRPGGSTELHLAELFAGDPLLTGGTGFGFAARIEGSALVVAAPGGAEHRRAL